MKSIVVGSAVTRTDKRQSEHGVVTEVVAPLVIVKWHLKQDEIPVRGPSGTLVGTVYEDPVDLVPDTACPHCRIR